MNNNGRKGKKRNVKLEVEENKSHKTNKKTLKLSIVITT